MEEKIILIVDDHKSFREMLRQFIREQNIKTLKVKDVSSGEEAIEYAKKNIVSVLIVDYQLQGMTGIETAKKIKTLYKNIKVILISMYVCKETLVDNTGFSDCIDFFLKKDELDEKITPIINEYI